MRMLVPHPGARFYIFRRWLRCTGTRLTARDKAFLYQVWYDIHAYMHIVSNEPWGDLPRWTQGGEQIVFMTLSVCMIRTGRCYVSQIGLAFILEAYYDSEDCCNDIIMIFAPLTRAAHQRALCLWGRLSVQHLLDWVLLRRGVTHRRPRSHLLLLHGMGLVEICSLVHLQWVWAGLTKRGESAMSGFPSWY